MSRLSDATVQHLRQVADWPVPVDERLEIRGVLGRGGMGTVYRAYDRALGREVALKVLRPELSDAGWTDRLRRESRILASLEHPGIVPVHEIGTLADGRTYYLMRLVTGNRLDHLPASTGRSDRLRLFLRVCEAVAFAHSRGIVHRDLKPANVMLGAFGEVLVLDWGIALSQGSLPLLHAADSLEAPAGGDSLPGIALGTPGFMAPEQQVGESVDHRADIYALGAMLRTLSHGASEDEPAPRPLIAICDRAMAPAAADRYPSVTDLAGDITRFLDQAPISAYQENVIERLARTYARYQVPILLVVAYLIMRLLFLVLRPVR